jgi:hypothetical protein
MAASEVSQVLTWNGDEYILRCVEKPDYRIVTTYTAKAVESTVFHDRKIIGRATSVNDAKAKAQEHAGGV